MGDMIGNTYEKTKCMYKQCITQRKCKYNEIRIKTKYITKEINK